MNTLSRWVANIRWLLNHPPTDFTARQYPLQCDYCGGEYPSVSFMAEGVRHVVCWRCIAQVLDKVFREAQ